MDNQRIQRVNELTAAVLSLRQGPRGSAVQERIARILLTFAQIRALNVTPVTLIGAPGATRFISLVELLFSMTRTATAYANGGALEFRYTNAAGAKVTADIAASVVTTGGAGTEHNLVKGADQLTPVLNAPVVIRNATAPFITGTGTAVILARYRIWTP